jgi:hypothetical protein
LIGNDLPEGASVIDLGEAKLKDIQHERLYQLSIDDDSRSFPPLKTETPMSVDDALAERIQRHVEQHIERAFTSGSSGKTPMRLAVGGLAIAAIGLIMLALVAVAIVLLVKLAV